MKNRLAAEGKPNGAFKKNLDLAKKVGSVYSGGYSCRKITDMAGLLFAEGVIVLFFAVMQLLSKNKIPTHRLIFFASFGLGCALLYAWATASGVILRYPAFMGATCRSYS